MATYPPAASSAAAEFIDLAASAGLILDPWQQYVLTHGLGERADGSWASFKNSVWVPRQNGKGGIIEALELGWLFLTREELILHSAHEYKTAEEGYRRVRGLVENTPDLDRHVHKYWQANGEQGIELRRSSGGGRLKFIARSRGSGRGFSGDKNILDEAQEIIAAQMAALLPTMSARPDPQIWFFGTPPESADAWCYSLREDGESGADPRMMHLDWGTDLDPTDPEQRRQAARDVDLWYACNPTLGRRITEEYVRGEALPSGLGERFMTERLGAWLPRLVDGAGAPLTPEAWEALADAESRRSGDVAFAVDVTPSRDFASIAMYGLRADGLGHVELVDRRPGTDWLVERLVQLRERHKPVAIGLDAKGPAGSLLVELSKRGIEAPDDPEHPERGQLALPLAQDVAAGCGQLVDAVKQGTLRHIGQEPVMAAIRGAKTRPLGDAWAWARRVSTVDISPLVAATLARWAFESRAHLVHDDYDVLDSVF
ncbi:terminase [Kitasatospora sp. NPDC002551]|uniref:terminase n=1 Tax=Kitasatospora sp. NPDC002551 TaxID=3154539 RepID=UPI003329CAB6